APSETLSTAAITKLPSPATPPNQPPPSPPTAAISSPARTEGSFMPLRDTTLVDFQPPTTQHHTPDDLPSEHLPSANLPHSTSLHQVEISPRIYLDDIAVSPYPGTRTPVVTPSQSDRRHSRSPNRLTPNRASPPLTRSAQRRRSAKLSTPHQSPTDSPISFVTPVRKTSPGRKSPRQRKAVKLATHNMTLRARGCPNKTTRCARLPNTN
ncbi:Hypothetical predicted protein, partial [Paramuricea clavata]